MPNLDALKWYHLFDSWVTCPTAELEIVANVLLKGPQPNPDPNCRTQTNEKVLGIAPPHVYAYLGRLHESFGAFALMLSSKGLAGTMSPFDTGGLVGNLVPVCNLTDGEKKAYCVEFSWNTTERTQRLAQYPGDQVEHYLNGDNSRPDCDGPHCRFDGGTEAGIWTEVNQDPRAWTWEGRTADGLNISELLAWTAPTSFFVRFRNYVSSVPEEQREQYRTLMTKYEKGGVKALLERQAAEVRAS